MKRYCQLLFIAVCTMLTACASSSIEREGAAYRITLPIGDSVVEFPAEGFNVEIADKSRPYYYLTNKKSGLNASFNFELANKCDSSQSCRDYFANKLKMSNYKNKKNWRMSQIGDVFVSENMDGPVSGFNLRQQHMNAHYVRDGVWIDVHLSKVDYKEVDRALFVNFIRSITIKPKTN